MNSKTLNVAVVRPYLTIKKGGAERYAVDLIHGLTNAGHHVHAFALEWDTPEQPGATYVRVPAPRKPAWLRVLLFHLNLRRRLQLDDYDAVLGLAPFWPQQVCWLGDGLYWVWVRIVWPIALVRRIMSLKRAVMTVNLWLEKRMLASPTAVFIANSQLVARQARQIYGVSKERVQIIYPWIDAERFNTASRQRWRDATRSGLKIRDDEIVLLFAANNFKRKGLDLALDALAEIDRGRPPLRLVVVGAGKIARYRRKANKLGLAEAATFVGAVGEIERYYAAADVFILPTSYDPCATVCLEAMACGLPVITTKMNGAAEFIEQGVNGYVLEANASAASLAAAILSLASSQRCASARPHERVRQLTASGHLQQITEALNTFAQSRRMTFPVRLDPTLVVNEAHVPLLKQHRLTSYLAFVETPRRTEFVYNQGKRMSLLRLDDHRTARRLYLKINRQRDRWIDKFRRILGQSVKTESAKEWQNILEFQRAGLPTPTPVALGERRLDDGSVESFLATLGLDDYMPLDDYVATRLAAPLSDAALREKRRLTRAVAQLARKMHGATFNHRDFYLCHIFVKVGETGLPDLRLIDLQRVGRRMFPCRRWRVKDLAQVHYSSLGLPISDHDRLRFFAQYSGLPRRHWLRRRTIRRVLRKSHSIAKHDARLRARNPTPTARSDFENKPDLAEISSRQD